MRYEEISLIEEVAVDASLNKVNDETTKLCESKKKSYSVPVVFPADQERLVYSTAVYLPIHVQYAINCDTFALII